MDRRGLLLVCLVLCLLSAGCFELEGQRQDRQSQTTGEIYHKLTVGQSFLATHDRLSRVDIRLATYGRENTHEIIFELREAGAQDPAIHQTIQAQSIKNNAYHSFHFDPITNSLGRTYIFTLSSPGSEPGNAITAWYHTDDVYENGTIFLDEKPGKGDLRFRIYHTKSLREVAVLIFKRITEDWIFFIFWCLLLMITASTILWFQRREK
jgi:hypothetical protein